ncbi:hypothetical protein A0H81_10370 [Grifola frondosa]|uniref:T6SS Phospholipase effector Tle1-like catalytic domain-containing protein n=1 Tax=Grifola frondosa TaxID=5627 RepID=A0A1C7M480_GRIFR|nr:hypothetical protein A0H81_10370 [Grifola frondosa]
MPIRVTWIRTRDHTTMFPRGSAPRDSVRQSGRNLVVCIDPAHIELGQSLRTRNIDQLHKKLVRDETQLTYYSGGIGTYTPPSKWSLWKRYIDGKLKLGMAWLCIYTEMYARDFDPTVKEAYGWLAGNYRDGDVIYCFGYSRDALMVLTLAAMIHKVGLIHAGNEAA